MSQQWVMAIPSRPVPQTMETSDLERWEPEEDGKDEYARRRGRRPRYRGVRAGKGTDTADPAPFWPSWASRDFLVVSAGFALEFWSECTPGEVRGSAVSVPFHPPREEEEEVVKVEE
eukprot:228794-Pyramimonas_sp.AAC.1